MKKFETFQTFSTLMARIVGFFHVCFLFAACEIETEVLNIYKLRQMQLQMNGQLLPLHLLQPAMLTLTPRLVGRRIPCLQTLVAVYSTVVSKQQILLSQDLPLFFRADNLLCQAKLLETRL